MPLLFPCFRPSCYTVPYTNVYNFNLFVKDINRTKPYVCSTHTAQFERIKVISHYPWTDREDSEQFAKQHLEGARGEEVGAGIPANIADGMEVVSDPRDSIGDDGLVETVEDVFLANHGVGAEQMTDMLRRHEV
jgi:hypothetical protein